MWNGPWSPLEYAAIRAAYLQKTDPAELAKKLGRSSASITRVASALGLTKRRKAWKAEEDELIRDELGRTSFVQLAARLNRTPSSVKARAFVLGIGAGLREGWYSPTELAPLLGVSVSWIQRRIRDGIIKAPLVNGVHKISDEELKSFVTRYHRELQGRAVDLSYIVQLLTGT